MDVDLHRITTFLHSVKVPHYVFALYLGLSNRQTEVLEATRQWKVNDSTPCRKYFDVINFYLDKIGSETTLGEHLWRAAINCDVGWGYYRFLKDNNLGHFVGDVDLLPQGIGKYPRHHDIRRYCMVVARGCHTNLTLRRWLQSEFDVPQRAAYGYQMCDFNRHKSVLDLYSVLESGYNKLRQSEFLKTVEQAVREAELLPYYHSLLRQNGFLHLLQSGKTSVDGQGTSGHGVLDPSNPL